jgi:hypothetical protein
MDKLHKCYVESAHYGEDTVTVLKIHKLQNAGTTEISKRHPLSGDSMHKFLPTTIVKVLLRTLSPRQSATRLHKKECQTSQSSSSEI